MLESLLLQVDFECVPSLLQQHEETGMTTRMPLLSDTGGSDAGEEKDDVGDGDDGDEAEEEEDNSEESDRE